MIILILALIQTIRGSSSEWKFYYNSGELMEEVVYMNDLPNGEYRRYYQSGKLEQEGNLVDGYQHGPWKIYYEKGETFATGHFNNGHRIGLWRVFYISGALKAEGIFTTTYAPFKEYYLSGALESDRIIYGFGDDVTEDSANRIGVIYGNVVAEDSGYCKYYYESGALMSEGEFINGLEHGHWRMYYPSGYLASENVWEEGYMLQNINYTDNTIWIQKD